MPRINPLLVLIAIAFALLYPARAAIAQPEDCHCNCYFGSDCSSGNFCDWGASFTIEDGCWWRTPKANGNVGAGCNVDYGNFGQCDGKCAPLGGAAASIVGNESSTKLRLGVTLWAQALTDASMAGGGTPSREAIARIDAIGFDNPTMTHGLWRMVIEALMLARGSNYVVFPPTEAFTLWEVAVADLTGNPVAKSNGDVVIQALLAEMDTSGSGRPILDGVDAAGLDAEIFRRICGDEPIKMVDCLHVRMSDMGTVLRGGGGAAAGEVQPSCPGCVGDMDPNDAVDFQDLLMILGRWGDESFPLGDLSGNGIIDFADLIDLLSRWGTCTSPDYSWTFCSESVRTALDGVDAAIRVLDGIASRLRLEPQHLLARKARTASRDEVHE